EREPPRPKQSKARQKRRGAGTSKANRCCHGFLLSDLSDLLRLAFDVPAPRRFCRAFDCLGLGGSRSNARRICAAILWSIFRTSVVIRDSTNRNSRQSQYWHAAMASA